MKKRIVATLGAVVVAAGLGLGAGSAVAIVPSIFAQSGLTAGKGVQVTPIPAPTYAVNSEGKTFGSAAESDKPGDEPDLIQAIATNGASGYVLKKDLDAVDGTDASLSFKSPADALAWQATAAAQSDHTIPVYAVDGTTQIGEFVVEGDAASSAAESTPPPSN